MNAYIQSIAYYLPEKILANDELVKEFPEWTAEKILEKLGIRQRHIAAKNETAADMAVLAAEKLFVENEIDRTKIDFVLLCTQSPDYYLPTTACLVQERLGLPRNIGALDFNLGCSGYVYGLSLAKGLIVAGIARRVLLLTSETYSKYINSSDKGNRTIFGDAATATLISTEGVAEIGNFALGTDGRGAENLIVKTGGARFPKRTGEIVLDKNGNPHSADYLFMDGAEIFNFTIETVPTLVQRVLQDNKLQQTDIRLFVFHQANKYIINFLRRKLKIKEEQFWLDMEGVGNTVSSTIPIALHDAFEGRKLTGNVLLVGFGVGYSWGGCVLKY